MVTDGIYCSLYEGGSPSDVGRALRRSGFRQTTASLSRMNMNYVKGSDNGVPLVLISAQMGIWQSYEKMLAPLSRSFHVFVVEARGYGWSSWTPREYTWSSMSGDIVEFIESVVGEPVIISANSSGGIIGLWCASHATRWVKVPSCQTRCA